MQPIKTKSPQVGFSLVELLVTVSIAAILAAIAGNLYRNYAIQAKVSEALNILEEYQLYAMNFYAKQGELPSGYDLLFPDGALDEAGIVAGSSPGNDSQKNVDLKYINRVSGARGSSGGLGYVLLGARLKTDGPIKSGQDWVYFAGEEKSNGGVLWRCGISASKGNTIQEDFLPKTCQEALP